MATTTTTTTTKNPHPPTNYLIKITKKLQSK